MFTLPALPMIATRYFLSSGRESDRRLFAAAIARGSRCPRRADHTVWGGALVMRLCWAVITGHDAGLAGSWRSVLVEPILVICSSWSGSRRWRRWPGMRRRHGAARAGLCWQPGRRESASRRWWEHSSVTCRRCAGPGACDRLFTSRPLRPLFDVASRLAGSCWICAGPGLAAKSCSPRCCARSASRGRWTWWSWRTFTGPTWPPSICCGLSAGASRPPACCSLPPTGTRIWPRGTRCGRRLASLPGALHSAGRAGPRCASAPPGQLRSHDLVGHDRPHGPPGVQSIVNACGKLRLDG
jgi:hypothetical protein